jgi:hypothetical protein
MRVLSLLFLIFTFGLARSAEWFVAPHGDDAAAGTLEAPFAGLMRAQQAAQPGDVVQIRGGTYAMTEKDIQPSRRRLYARLHVFEKSGTEGKSITYRAYQQEKPVFDCSAVKPDRRRVAAFSVQAAWLRFEGLAVTGVQVTMTGHTQSICFESIGSHNVFERLEMHDSQAIGIYHTVGSHNLFLNCDAWNNWDYTSEGGRGGNVDGFGCHPPQGSVGNVFRGCRAWFNSDDGYDTLGADEVVVVENCWAAWNGFTPDFKKRGDGNGFKSGGYASRAAHELPKIIPRHVVQQCLSIGNKAAGFYANHHPGGQDWRHNAAAFNGGGEFSLLGRLMDNVTDIPGVKHTLECNVAYPAHRALVKADVAQCELEGNHFTLQAADFISLDKALFTTPRRLDGSLPDIPLLKLAK